MKAIFTLISLLSSTAMACPNISGTYATADGLYIKFDQKDCASLTRFLGEIGQDGKITFPSVGMNYPLNGKPECTIRSFCTTAIALPDALKFDLNYDANVNTDSHGSCSERSHTLSLDNEGNLIGSYLVFNCADKFTGPALKTFKRF